MTTPDSHRHNPAQELFETVAFGQSHDNPLSETALPEGNEFRQTIIEGSARPLEVERGHWIPDGRIFQDCQCRQESFIIPGDTQAIILDFDGTTTPLKLSEGIRQMAFKEVISARLSAHPLTPDPKINDINMCLDPARHKPERKMAEIISDKLREHYEINVSAEEIWSDWVTHTSRRVADLKASRDSCGKAKIVRGVQEIYQQARDRGIPVAGCTNGEAGFVQMLGDAIGASHFLHPTGTVYTNLHPISPKPAPDPYLLTCEKLKVDPRKVVILEDSATGALAGLRAGGLVLLQPSTKRYKTLMQLYNTIQTEHPAWFEERQGKIVLLAQHQGFKQARFAPLNGAQGLLTKERPPQR